MYTRQDSNPSRSHTLSSTPHSRGAGIIISACTFSAGAALQAAAAGSPDAALAILYVGRFVGGIGIGMLAATVPIYIAEAAPEHARGRLATLWQLAIVLGIVLASLANLPLALWNDGWRLTYGGNGIFAIMLVVQMTCMPESPRWLAARGRETDLRTVLSGLRYADEVDAEVKAILAKAAEDRAAGSARWRDLLGHGECMRHRLLVGLGLMTFSTFSGINAIMFFAPRILSRYFSPTAALYGTLGINVINAFATLITFFGVDRIGRVTLLLVGGASMTLCHVIVMVLALAPPSTGVGVAILVCSCLFVCSFAYSLGPIAWMVNSEIFPMRARSKAMALTSAANWFTNTLLGKAFPLVPLPLAFACFAVCCFGGCCMCYLAQPETAALSLEQIGTAFAGHRPRCRRRFWTEARRAHAMSKAGEWAPRLDEGTGARAEEPGSVVVDAIGDVVVQVEKA